MPEPYEICTQDAVGRVNGRVTVGYQLCGGIENQAGVSFSRRTRGGAALTCGLVHSHQTLPLRIIQTLRLLYADRRVCRPSSWDATSTRADGSW